MSYIKNNFIKGAIISGLYAAISAGGLGAIGWIFNEFGTGKGPTPYAVLGFVIVIPFLILSIPVFAIGEVVGLLNWGTTPT